MPIPLVPAYIAIGTFCSVVSMSYDIYYISTIHEKLATPYVDNRTHVYNTTKFIDSRVFNKIEHKTLVYLNQHSSCNFSFPSMRGSEDANGSNSVSALAIEHAVGKATLAEMNKFRVYWQKDMGQLSEACKGHHDPPTAHALEIRKALEEAMAAKIQTLSLQWKTNMGQLSGAFAVHRDHSTAQALEVREAVEAATAEILQYQVEVMHDWSTLSGDMREISAILATGCKDAHERVLTLSTKALADQAEIIKLNIRIGDYKDRMAKCTKEVTALEGMIQEIKQQHKDALTQRDQQLKESAKQMALITANNTALKDENNDYQIKLAICKKDTVILAELIKEMEKQHKDALTQRDQQLKESAKQMALITANNTALQDKLTELQKTRAPGDCGDCGFTVTYTDEYSVHKIACLVIIVGCSFLCCWAMRYKPERKLEKTSIKLKHHVAVENASKSKQLIVIQQACFDRLIEGVNTQRHNVASADALMRKRQHPIPIQQEFYGRWMEVAKKQKQRHFIEDKLVTVRCGALRWYLTAWRYSARNLPDGENPERCPWLNILRAKLAQSRDALDHMNSSFGGVIEAVKSEHAKLLKIQKNPLVLMTSPWNVQSIANRLTPFDCLSKCLDETEQVINRAAEVQKKIQPQIQPILDSIENMTADQTTGSDDDNDENSGEPVQPTTTTTTQAMDLAGDYDHEIASPIDRSAIDGFDVVYDSKNHEDEDFLESSLIVTPPGTPPSSPRVMQPETPPELKTALTAKELLIQRSPAARVVRFAPAPETTNTIVPADPADDYNAEIGNTVGSALTAIQAYDSAPWQEDEVQAIEELQMVVWEPSVSAGWGQIVRAVLQLTLLGVMLWYIIMVLPDQCPADTYHNTTH
jgi:hypothetical protein